MTMPAWRFEEALARVFAPSASSGDEPALPVSSSRASDGAFDTQPHAGHAADRALVARIRAGDRAQFAAWYAELYQEACGFAYRFLHDTDQAADVVQEVFLSLWNRRTTWSPTGSARAYVFAAVRRQALHQLRHHRVVERIQRDAEPSEADYSALSGMGVAPESPETATAEASLQHAMRCHVLALPERQRTALILRWQHGHTNAEIAQILGVGEPAVSRLLARATAALRAVWDNLVA